MIRIGQIHQASAKRRKSDIFTSALSGLAILGIYLGFLSILMR